MLYHTYSYSIKKYQCILDPHLLYHTHTGADLGKKSDGAGILAAKRSGGADGEAGQNLDGAEPHLDEAGPAGEARRKIFPPPLKNPRLMGRGFFRWGGRFLTLEH